MSVVTVKLVYKGITARLIGPKQKEKIPSGVDVEINDLSITASNEIETEIPSHKQHNEEHFAIGDYVAATYLNKWYIGIY